MKKHFLKSVLLVAAFMFILLASKQVVFAEEDTVTITIHMGGHAEDVVFTHQKGLNSRISGKDILDQITAAGIQQDSEDYYLFGWGEKESYDSVEDFSNNGGHRFTHLIYINTPRDLELYAVWQKKIKEVELSAIQPLCGVTTSSEKDSEGYVNKQTNLPKMEIAEKSKSEVMQIPDESPGMWTDRSYSLSELYNDDIIVEPYTGTFKGGETYHFLYTVCPKWGYTFDLDPNKTVVKLNGATLNNYYVGDNYKTNIEDLPYFTWLDLSADITAEHDWDAGTVTKKPTETAEGEKTFKCIACNETKTETIPKIKPSGSDPNQKGKDGTDVGPGESEACADKAITNIKDEKDLAGSEFSKLQLKSTNQTKTSIKISWKKNSKAVKYIIYASKCGKKIKPQKQVVITGNHRNFSKISGKKLNKGSYYKFIVVALDKNNMVVSTSKLIHVATKGGKVCNHKSLKIEKNVISKAKKIKKGKSLKLNATTVLQDKKLKVNNHVGLRYESTNKNVATVTSKGMIKGKKKGSCTVYVYAQNGVMKAINVKVK